MVSFNEKRLRKIAVIFDIENWLWKSNFGTFDTSLLHQFSKFYNFRQKYFWFCTPCLKTKQPILPLCSSHQLLMLARLKVICEFMQKKSRAISRCWVHPIQYTICAPSQPSVCTFFTTHYVLFFYLCVCLFLYVCILLTYSSPLDYNTLNQLNSEPHFVKE